MKRILRNKSWYVAAFGICILCAAILCRWVLYLLILCVIAFYIYMEEYFPKRADFLFSQFKNDYSMVVSEAIRYDYFANEYRRKLAPDTNGAPSQEHCKGILRDALEDRLFLDCVLTDKDITFSEFERKWSKGERQSKDIIPIGDGDYLLSQDYVAKLLYKDTSTISRWREKGKIKVTTMIGAKPYFSKQYIMKMMKGELPK